MSTMIPLPIPGPGYTRYWTLSNIHGGMIKIRANITANDNAIFCAFGGSVLLMS